MGLMGARRTIALAVFFVTLAIAIAISQHDSSQVALIRSSIILLLAWSWRRPVVRVLVMLWCAAFVLVIPADFLAYRAGLHLVRWLPESARARVIIWGVYGRAHAHPSLAWHRCGLHTSREGRGKGRTTGRFRFSPNHRPTRARSVLAKLVRRVPTGSTLTARQFAE